MLDVVRGLEFLHVQEVVHCFLSTDMIMVSYGEDDRISRLAIAGYDLHKRLQLGPRQLGTLPPHADGNLSFFVVRHLTDFNKRIKHQNASKVKKSLRTRTVRNSS